MWVFSHEGTAYVSGISALINGAPERPLNHLPGEDMGRRWPRKNQETGSHQTLKQPEIDPKFLSLQKKPMGHKCLLFITCLVYSILLQQLGQANVEAGTKDQD